MGTLDNIFALDPEAAPKERSSSKYEAPAFVVNGGYADRRGEMFNLATWRFTSEAENGKEILERLAELFGGTVEDHEGPSKREAHVVSDAVSLELVTDGAVIDGPIMQFDGPGQPPSHICDGSKSLRDDDFFGQPCGCPTTIEERKLLKKRNPQFKVRFRLMADEDLGEGEIVFKTWPQVQALAPVNKQLAAGEGEAVISVTKEFVSYTHKASGRLREFTKVTPKFEGRYQDVITQER